MDMTSMVKRLRRMISEPDAGTYTDAELKEWIEQSATRDKFGVDPSKDNWTPTYDIYRVASDIWGEKASAVSDEFDFSADGGSYTRSQKYDHALKQSAYYASRAMAGSKLVRQHPPERVRTSGWEDIP